MQGFGWGHFVMERLTMARQLLIGRDTRRCDFERAGAK
jgi:hypothetical protein